MRNIANWIQWTVIFLILGSAAWLVYPEIDPFEFTGEVPQYVHLKQTFFQAELTELNPWKTSPASPENESRL